MQSRSITEDRQVVQRAGNDNQYLPEGPETSGNISSQRFWGRTEIFVGIRRIAEHYWHSLRHENWPQVPWTKYMGETGGEERTINERTRRTRTWKNEGGQKKRNLTLN